MNVKLSSPTLLVIRPWTTKDTEFSLKVRNCPELKRWFRQDSDLTFVDQLKFIANDVEYNGKVVEADGEMVGLCSVKNTGEFTIGILPEHQGRGIAGWVMHYLTSSRPGVWSEVFVGNPALEFFIAKCGFKVTDVYEKKYYKKGFGYVDCVRISHE